MRLNLLAPLNLLSYGYVSLNILSELDRLGHEPAWFPVGGTEAHPRYHDCIRKASQRSQFFDSRAPSLKIFHQFALHDSIGKGLRCALPIFELTKFNEVEKHHLNSVDVIFSPTHWGGEVLIDNGIPPERIQYCPFGVDSSIFRPSPLPADERTTFLICGKWEYRKSHELIPDAFAKAFDKNENVRLIAACHNPCIHDPGKRKSYNESFEGLYKYKLGDRVQLIPRLPFQEDIARLMEQSDCLLAPSKAEGWNMPAAEASSMGRWVIGTNYSGHQEFLSQENSLLIEIDKLEAAFDGYFFQSGIGEWAHFGEPQIDQLVEHMRSVHRMKQDGTLKQNTAGIETFKKLSWENCVQEITSVLA